PRRAAPAAATEYRGATFRRLAAPVDTASPGQDANRVWYDGMLAPVTVEAPPHDKCTILERPGPPAQFRRAVAHWAETYKIEGAYDPVTMDMSLDQAPTTPAKRFWRTWRREIVRAGVLFTLVVFGGLGLRAMFHNVKAHIPESLGTLGSFGDFNWGDGEASDLFGHGREVGDAWHYSVLIKPTQRVWIRNTNGPIDVVAGTGDSLVIEAEKSWRNSDPQSVQLIPVLTERGLTVCALWDARERRCNEGGDYHISGVKKNDVAVRFTVQLPRNVPVDASTVNGGLQIDGVSAPVQAATVNGRIAVNTSTGPVTATTINGSIEANMQALTSGDVRLTTVNG